MVRGSAWPAARVETLQTAAASQEPVAAGRATDAVVRLPLPHGAGRQLAGPGQVGSGTYLPLHETAATRVATGMPAGASSDSCVQASLLSRCTYTLTLLYVRWTICQPPLADWFWGVLRGGRGGFRQRMVPHEDGSFACAQSLP